MDSTPTTPTSPDPKASYGLLTRLRASLLAKTALVIGISGAVLCIVLASVGSVLIRQHEQEEQLAHIGELLVSVDNNVQAACISGGRAQAAQAAGRLLALPSVAAVRIATPAGILSETVKKDSSTGLLPPLRKNILSPLEPHFVIGEITVQVDDRFILAETARNSTLLAATLAIEALAITAIALFFLLRCVIRPIATLGVGLNRFEKKLAAYLPPAANDEPGEIGHVAGLFSRMIDGLARLPDLEREIRDKATRSEQRFRTLAENSSEIVLRYNRELRLTYANPAYAREIKARRQSSPARDSSELLVWLPTMAREHYRDRLRHVVETGATDRMLWEWQTPSGHPVSHDMRLTPEYDSENRVVGVLVIGRNITERKEIERQIQHQATHDALTGLPNRILLKDRLQHAIAKARHEGTHLVVVFIDLDRFKDVNDTLGLDVGDQLLVLQAKRMQAALPDCDTVARLGGDDFVVLLEDSATAHEREAVVQKLRDAIATSSEIGGHRIFPGSNMGIAVYPEDGEDAETLMRNADTALYVAKGEGRNHYRFYSPDMNEELLEWMKLSSDLHLALENREFVLHYQPKIRPQDGALDGMEALLRWNHPTRGLVPPNRFIPIAEKAGLIGAIGAWVLNETCRQARAWLDEGLDPGRVAVNLSAVQCQGSHLPEQVRQALAEHSLPARHLEVEITETIMMSDAEESVRAFWTLRDMGVKIAVDDFGTGYSSLSYLKRLPVDTVKIDKSFVDDIEVDVNDTEIIRAIVAMAHSLKLETIAEGVETSLQYEFLRRVGCDQMQGYYFSRPLPAPDLAALLRRCKEATQTACA